MPKTAQLKWRGVPTLADMLQHPLADTLYYEVLDLPLPQLEQLKTLRARRPAPLPADTSARRPLRATTRCVILAPRFLAVPLLKCCIRGWP